jgi:methyltransferase family protein
LRFAALNPRDVIRGHRFGRRIPPAHAPRRERHPGTLEQYFDANLAGPGIWKWRHYFEIYERHLARFVGREVHVVEVGIYSGGSLEMWRHYFGERCRMYGIDIEPDCRAYERDGTTVFIGDQADSAFWARFRVEVPEVDVLIDDGGHEPHQQIATLKAMLAHIRPGGVYLCEDIHGVLQPYHAFVDGLCRPLHAVHSAGGATAPSSLHQHVASVHRYPLITVIEKPAGRVPPFEAPRRGTKWQPFFSDL